MTTVLVSIFKTGRGSKLIYICRGLTYNDDLKGYGTFRGGGGGSEAEMKLTEAIQNVT
jgi:hypothetical protein